jgi:hypothetical protein
MGVKCSLLGHDYGDSEVERERDEEGNEVVRTAKRVERCQSCGHTRTISANTEVTALEAAAGVVREPDGTVVAATDGSTMAEEIAGNAVIEPTGGTERTPDTHETAEPPESDGIESNGGSESDGGEPIETLAIDRIDHIERDSEPPRAARAPGEWPAEPDTAADGRGSSVGDAEAAIDWSGSDTPAADDGADDGEETANGKRRTRQPGDTLSCGSCGFATPIADSPLRAGDICPGCGTGYLAWETRKG